MAELTKAERAWIASLRRVAAKRPETLGLWGGLGNGMRVIALNEDGGTQHREGFPVDTITSTGEAVCIVTSIAIPCGGGDPENFAFDELDRPWVVDGEVGDDGR